MSLSWLRAAWVLCGQEPGVEEAAGGAEKRGAARNGLHAICCTWAGTLVAPQHRQAPAGRSELDAGLLCSRRTMSKDARRNSRNAKDSVVPQLATECPGGDGRVVTRAATVAMATFPIKPYNKPRAVNGEEPEGLNARKHQTQINFEINKCLLYPSSFLSSFLSFILGSLVHSRNVQ